MQEAILDVSLMLEAMQILKQDQMLEVMQEAILDVNQILEHANKSKVFIFEYLFLCAIIYKEVEYEKKKKIKKKEI